MDLAKYHQPCKLPSDEGENVFHPVQPISDEESFTDACSSLCDDSGTVTTRYGNPSDTCLSGALLRPRSHYPPLRSGTYEGLS